MGQRSPVRGRRWKGQSQGRRISIFILLEPGFPWIFMVLCIIHREGGLTLQVIKRVKIRFKYYTSDKCCSHRTSGCLFYHNNDTCCQSILKFISASLFHSPLQCLQKHCVCFSFALFSRQQLLLCKYVSWGLDLVFSPVLQMNAATPQHIRAGFIWFDGVDSASTPYCSLIASWQ